MPLADCIEDAADADHERAPRCTWCGRAGRPYEYKGVKFDGLTDFKGDRLCPACRDAKSTAEGIPVLVDPGSYRIPYVVTIGRPPDTGRAILRARSALALCSPSPLRARTRGE